MSEIDALPVPPGPSDSRELFNSRAFSFWGAMPNFREQANSLRGEVNTWRGEAATSAASALAQANAAAASAATSAARAADALVNAASAAANSGATAFVSGASVTAGSDKRWSLINGRAYVALTSGVRTVDPALDRVNWGDLVDMPRVRVTSATALQVGKIYEIDSTGGPFNLTMPATFAATDRIGFVDVGLALDINPVTVLRNGNNIRRLPEDLICDRRGDSFFLVGQTTIGWIEE